MTYRRRALLWLASFFRQESVDQWAARTIPQPPRIKRYAPDRPKPTVVGGPQLWFDRL